MKKGWTGTKIAILAVCCALIGGGTGVAGVIFGNMLIAGMQAESPDSVSEKNDGTDTSVVTMVEGARQSSVLEVAHIDSSRVMTPAEIYAANVNSTVGITTTVTTNMWGYQVTSPASGSGFIITEDGYILTNYHVIENSNTIKVSMYNGDVYDAEVIGYDVSNDIAVLKVDAEGLTPVIIGDSRDMNVGDTVAAIGNPLGELTFSLTTGIVSALNRKITISNSLMLDLIQTDCAINAGNSGGPLFNSYGEVIGVINAKYSGSGMGTSVDNIGFAIPINQVRNIVESIIEKGYISKPYIGVSVTDVSREMLAYGLPEGAAVKEIFEGSPAEDAGLQINDIITKVNDKEISGSSELVEIVRAANVDDELMLTIYRQGEMLEVEVIVGENVQSAIAGQDNMQSMEGQQEQIPGLEWLIPGSGY